MIKIDKNAQRLLQKKDNQTLWSVKYFPKKREEIPLFKKSQIEKFENLINNCILRKQGTPKVIIVSGPVGCGKTTLVRVICNEKNIQIVNFSPDEGIVDKSLMSENESFFLAKLKIFVEKSQLVTNPLTQQILLLDNIQLANDDKNGFFEIIENYNADRRRLFPLVWIADLNDMRRKIPNCYYFNFPPASNSVLKRVINNVAKNEHLKLTKSQIDDLLAENPGDVRLAVNTLQFARNFPSGKYDYLSYFQAIGEILYQKNKRSSEEILRISQCSPQTMIHGLYENCLDFFSDIEDYAQAIDSITIADVFSESAWLDQNLSELSATTAMRGVLTSNNNRRQNIFYEYRPGFKSHLKNVQKSDLYNLESVIENTREELMGNNQNIQDHHFECWPVQMLRYDANFMDSYLFSSNAKVEKSAIIPKINLIAKYIHEQELCEAMKILTIDPIEDDIDEDFFN